MNRVHAFILLGWHLAIHALQKVTFLYDAGGLELFRENFTPEGLYSLTDRERELLSEWQRCIGCGLCEAVCPEMSVIPQNRHAGPRYVAMAAMRDLSDSEHALPAAESLDDCDCAELEAICPVDIPLCELAEFLQEVGRTERAITGDEPDPS